MIQRLQPNPNIIARLDLPLDINPPESKWVRLEDLKPGRQIPASPHRVRHFRGKPLPPNTKLVTRPSRWGNPWHADVLADAMCRTEPYIACNRRLPVNPYTINHTAADRRAYFQRMFSLARALAVQQFAEYCLDAKRADPAAFEAWIAPLRGFHLACYCPLDRPCHADILLALAREPSFSPPSSNPKEQP